MVKMVKYIVAIVALVAVVAGVAIAKPDDDRNWRTYEERHFDHSTHAQKLKADGVAAVECAHCHATSDARATLLDGPGAIAKKRDHAGCEGGSCHGVMEAMECKILRSPERTKQHQLQACFVCHFSTGGGCLDGSPAPTPRPAPAFGHGHHVENLTDDTARTAAVGACLACHESREPRVVAKPSPKTHALCAACHVAGQVASGKPMSGCETCHGAAPALATASTDPNRIDNFAHATHMGKTPRASCIDCHGRKNGAAADSRIRAMMLPAFDWNKPRDVPADLQGTCGKCHDGAVASGHAFSVVGTTCTKCHAIAHGSVPATRTDVPFSHDTHKGYGVDMSMTACDGCHAVKPDGALDKPGTKKDHQPCAKSGCHAARDFASKTPTICGVCHDATAAWAKATSRARTPSKVEWFQNINHAAHLKNPNVQCETCHGQKLALMSSPKPHDHEDCAPCHGKGQQPPISSCAACHSRVTPARAPVSAWSVAAAFDHGKHGRDNRTALPACVSCHASVPAAQKLADITTPRMHTEGSVKGCDACHDGGKRSDGKVVFKTTGFLCAKCHKKAEVAFR